MVRGCHRGEAAAWVSERRLLPQREHVQRPWGRNRRQPAGLEPGHEGKEERSPGRQNRSASGATVRSVAFTLKEMGSYWRTWQTIGFTLNYSFGGIRGTATMPYSSPSPAVAYAQVQPMSHAGLTCAPHASEKGGTGCEGDLSALGLEPRAEVRGQGGRWGKQGRGKQARGPPGSLTGL